MPPLIEQAAGDHGGDLNEIGFGGLIGAVAEHDVAHFVAEDAGDLGFVIGGGDEAGVNVHGPAGEGEGVDGGVVDDFEGEGKLLAFDGIDEAFTDAIDVGVESGIGNDLELGFDLLGVFLPHFDVLVGGEEVPTGLESALFFGREQEASGEDDLGDDTAKLHRK